MASSSRCGFTAEDVRILKRETVYRGFFAMERIELSHRRYQGGWTPPISRELFLRPPAVGVLAYDPVRDRVVLAEQFRVGALEGGYAGSPWLLELVAGMAESSESPESVARREMREETGCELGRMHEITRYFSTPGGSDERIHLYCGEVDSSAAGGIHGVASENEDIRVVAMTREDAESAMHEGELNNAMTLIAIQWLALNRSALLQSWGKAE